MVVPPPDHDQLMLRAAAGDAQAWGTLLTGHEQRLCRMVGFRLDRRLQGRVDARDVVQDAYVEAAKHRADYFAREPLVPLFLWLRGVVENKLLEVHRHHLATPMRNAAREVGLQRGAPNATSVALVAQLSGHATGPGTAAGRAEIRLRLQAALEAMDAIDREVLALRHFEQLSNGEAAHVLGIQERAAAKRYVRDDAAIRLREAKLLFERARERFTRVTTRAEFYRFVEDR